MDSLERTDMTSAQAERLCEQIDAAVNETWRLLTVAHDGRAWLVLGYGSWDELLLRRFGISPTTGGRLLTQGAVILAIEEAATVKLPPGAITQDAAAKIKPTLPAVVAKVRDATRGKRSKRTRTAAAVEVVETVTETSPQVSGVRNRGSKPRNGHEQLSLFDLAQPIPHRPPANTVEAERARTLARQLNTWAARLDNTTAPTRQVVSRLKGQKPA